MAKTVFIGSLGYTAHASGGRIEKATSTSDTLLA